LEIQYTRYGNHTGSDKAARAAEHLRDAADPGPDLPELYGSRPEGGLHNEGTLGTILRGTPGQILLPPPHQLYEQVSRPLTSQYRKYLLAR